MAYITAFEKKHDTKFDFWVSERVGEIAFIGDYCFNFSDIKLDIDTDQPKNFIFEWYHDIVMQEKRINYKSYINRAR